LAIEKGFPSQQRRKKKEGQFGNPQRGTSFIENSKKNPLTKENLPLEKTASATDVIVTLGHLSEVVERLDRARAKKGRATRRRINDAEPDLDEGQRQALAAAVVVWREEDPYNVGPLERAQEIAHEASRCAKSLREIIKKEALIEKSQKTKVHVHLKLSHFVTYLRMLLKHYESLSDHTYPGERKPPELQTSTAEMRENMLSVIGNTKILGLVKLHFEEFELDENLRSPTEDFF
jgi:hypothetical protein